MNAIYEESATMQLIAYQATYSAIVSFRQTVANLTQTPYTLIIHSHI